MLEEAAKERRKPHEKHHIFSQAFRKWFTDQGINIDEYVIPLERSIGASTEGPTGVRGMRRGTSSSKSTKGRSRQRRSTGMRDSSSTSSSCSAR
jgi:hypothetical protein